MPIPIFARQARLIVDGVSYELGDLHVMQTDSVERERLTADGGRTIGFTSGRISNRVTIEADVMPELSRERAWDRDLRAMALATAADINAIAKALKPAEIPTTQPPAPEPRSRWLRLLDDHNLD